MHRSKLEFGAKNGKVNKAKKQKGHVVNPSSVAKIDGQCGRAVMPLRAGLQPLRNGREC